MNVVTFLPMPAPRICIRMLLALIKRATTSGGGQPRVKFPPAAHRWALAHELMRKQRRRYGFPFNYAHAPAPARLQLATIDEIGKERNGLRAINGLLSVHNNGDGISDLQHGKPRAERLIHQTMHLRQSPSSFYPSWP